MKFLCTCTICGNKSIFKMEDMYTQCPTSNRDYIDKCFLSFCKKIKNKEPGVLFFNIPRSCSSCYRRQVALYYNPLKKELLCGERVCCYFS